MLKRQIALLAAALLCLVAAPASATHHSGKAKGSKHDSVLLKKSSGRGVAAQVALLRSIRLDFRDFGRHDNGLHLGHLKKKLKGHSNGPKPPTGGGIPGGGGVVKPPTHGDGVPMPEPSAALLFALGMGMVGLRLRARR